MQNTEEIEENVAEFVGSLKPGEDRATREVTGEYVPANINYFIMTFIAFLQTYEVFTLMAPIMLFQLLSKDQISILRIII